jgi:hypothetical protein
MFRIARSILGKGTGRRGRVRARLEARVEALEGRALKSTVTVDVDQVIRTVNDHVLGADLAGWDPYLSANHDGSGVTPDPGTLAMIQDAGLKMLRLSNGSGADEWHFSGQNEFPDGAGLLANMAAAAGADALVTVNYGTGTPEEAAAYVAYLNGTTDNQFAIGVDAHGVNWGTVADWASLRGQTPVGGDPLDELRAGHPDPYGFSHFEVGNEVYFHGWNGAPASVDPADYVGFAKSFAAKVAMIDPTASIGLDVGNPIEYDALWNVPMLQQCAAQGYTPGFLSDHFYVYDGNNETLSDADLLEHSVNDPTSTMPIHADAPRSWAGRAAAFRGLLTDQLGAAGAGVELICAEFNADADAANKQSTSLVRGLFLADAIGGVLQTEYNAVVCWDLRNGYQDQPDDPSYYGWRTGTDEGLIGSDNGSAPATGPYVAYPAYFAEELASKMIHTGDTVVQAVSDRDDLSAYAVMQQDGHLALLVINKSPDEDISESFDIHGFLPSGALQSWQYGKAQDQAQSETADGSASLDSQAYGFDVTATATGGQFTLSFPSYSMTVIDLSPSGAPVTPPPVTPPPSSPPGAGTPSPTSPPGTDTPSPTSPPGTVAPTPGPTSSDTPTTPLGTAPQTPTTGVPQGPAHHRHRHPSHQPPRRHPAPPIHHPVQHGVRQHKGRIRILLAAATGELPTVE